MNSPDPFAVKHLKISFPVKVYRELKAKCAADGVSIMAAIEDLVGQYVAGKLNVTRKPE